MRYRPFGREGRSISALTLALGDEPRGEAARLRLIYAALEQGVNAFELRGERPEEGAATLSRAAAALPPEAVVVSLRLSADARSPRPFARDWVIQAVERVLSAGGRAKLDLLVFDLPGAGAFDDEVDLTHELTRVVGQEPRAHERDSAFVGAGA